MGNCLASFYSCACCECNFMIFPAPEPTYTKESHKEILRFFTNSSGHKVPYICYLSENPEWNIIFFHGNAEDIGHSISFLGPIIQQLDASLYSIEYPSYGQYQVGFPARISNKIKSDALQFFEELVRTSEQVINRENTIVLGRSIGSGGASYLASQKNMHNLVLISPFSNIPSVATDFVGCVGKVVKCHFDNQEEIKNYNGRLLIIHGKSDEVIQCKHGELLYREYLKKNPTKCKGIFPKDMSHNHFNYKRDILNPIVEFVQDIESKKMY